MLPPSRPPSTAVLLDIPPEISTPAPPYGVIGASLDDSQLLNAVDFPEPLQDDDLHETTPPLAATDDRHETTPPLAASDDLRDSIPPRRSSRLRRAPLDDLLTCNLRHITTVII